MDTSKFTPELILGIIGTVTGILSLVISMHFNRKAINQAEKALEQSDKNLKTQLLYEDKKKALMNFQRTLSGAANNTRDLREKIDTFLDSFEGKYVPKDVVGKVHASLEELEKYEYENAEYSQKWMGEEPMQESESSDPCEGMNPTEQFNYEFGKKIDSFKHSAKYLINESLMKI